jgi:hypothetical protein
VALSGPGGGIAGHGQGQGQGQGQATPVITTDPIDQHRPWSTSPVIIIDPIDQHHRRSSPTMINDHRPRVMINTDHDHRPRSTPMINIHDQHP